MSQRRIMTPSQAVQGRSHTPCVHVRPGQFVVATDLRVLSATIGKAMAVCLADPCNRIYGMSLLSAETHLTGFDRPTPACDQGTLAIDWLHNLMMQAGAERPWMHGMVFSSACRLPVDPGRIGATSMTVFDKLKSLGVHLSRVEIGNDRNQILNWRVPLHEPEVGPARDTINPRAQGNTTAAEPAAPALHEPANRQWPQLAAGDAATEGRRPEFA